MAKRERPTKNQLLSTAYHEAGHVAVAYHLGLRIGRKATTIVGGRTILAMIIQTNLGGL